MCFLILQECTRRSGLLVVDRWTYESTRSKEGFFLTVTISTIKVSPTQNVVHWRLLMHLTKLLWNRLWMSFKQEWEIRFLDPNLPLWTSLVENNTIDSVHGWLGRVHFRLNKTLDSAIVNEILPVIDILEHIIHREGNSASRLTHHTWMVIFSSIE